MADDIFGIGYMVARPSGRRASGARRGASVAGPSLAHWWLGGASVGDSSLARRWAVGGL